MLIFLCILFGLWAAVATFYLYRFVRIIMILEDDLSDAVETLMGAETTISEFLNMQMHFDSPEVQREVTGALQGVQAAKVAVARLVSKFTERSRQKFVQVVEVENEN